MLQVFTFIAAAAGAATAAVQRGARGSENDGLRDRVERHLHVNGWSEIQTEVPERHLGLSRIRFCCVAIAGPTIVSSSAYSYSY